MQTRRWSPKKDVCVLGDDLLPVFGEPSRSAGGRGASMSEMRDPKKEFFSRPKHFFGAFGASHLRPNSLAPTKTWQPSGGGGGGGGSCRRSEVEFCSPPRGLPRLPQPGWCWTFR